MTPDRAENLNLSTKPRNNFRSRQPRPMSVFMERLRSHVRALTFCRVGLRFPHQSIKFTTHERQKNHSLVKMTTVSPELNKGKWQINMAVHDQCTKKRKVSHPAVACSFSVYRLLSVVMEKAGDTEHKLSLMKYFYEPASPDWEKAFRRDCESVGPQSWRRFLPGLHWFVKRYSTCPTKEWKAFVDQVIEAYYLMNLEDLGMLIEKFKLQVHGKVPQDRNLAYW